MGQVKKRSTLEKALIDLLGDVWEKGNMVIIRQPVLRLCDKDVDIATMLSHLIYLTDKGLRPDGFIWKSAREWFIETGLKRNQLEKAKAWLIDRSLLDVRKMMAMGKPTWHYRIKQDALIDAIRQSQQGHLSKSAVSIGRDKQIHNIDTIIDTDIKTDKGSSPSNDGVSKHDVMQGRKMGRALTLKEFLAESEQRGEPTGDEAIDTIGYFLSEYKRKRGEGHPRMTYIQWQGHVNTILSAQDQFGRISNFDSDDLKIMIDDYFNTSFENCDYRLHHFNNDGVKMVRTYELGVE